MYGVSVAAGTALRIPASVRPGRRQRSRRKPQIERKDPGGARTLRRQRRPQHAGPLRRRRLLQAPSESRHPEELSPPIDDHFGFSGGMAGFERLYKDGKLAIVHGCGYENPSFSHFTSMAYWHTAAPNSGEQYGWVGRLADTMAPEAPPNFIVNIDSRGSRSPCAAAACARGLRRSQQVFAGKFLRRARGFQSGSDSGKVDNPSRKFLLDTARSAKDASRWCAKPGPNIIRRSTTESRDSICRRWSR
jgi:hypothetical protein